MAVTFGTVITTAGELMGIIVTRIAALAGVPADWVFIGEEEDGDLFVTRTNDTVILVDYLSTSGGEWQRGGGANTQLRMATFRVIVYRRSELDAARQQTQAINNAVTGVNTLIETIYDGLAQWYPESAPNVAMLVEPIVGRGIRKSGRQVRGFTKMEAQFEMSFLC